MVSINKIPIKDRIQSPMITYRVSSGIPWRFLELETCWDKYQFTNGTQTDYEDKTSKLQLLELVLSPRRLCLSWNNLSAPAEPVVTIQRRHVVHNNFVRCSTHARRYSRRSADVFVHYFYSNSYSQQPSNLHLVHHYFCNHAAPYC